jgi:glycosyltransferase involved in cell wall biosynthesis
VRAVGYDAIPFISADLRPFGEPNAFASYLTVLKYADRVCAVSESAASEFAGYAHALAAQGLPGPRVSAVPNPASVPPAPRGYVRVPPARPLVVTVGRLEPHKNHTALLNAVERLWRRGHRFDLVIVGGPGWDTRRVKAQLRRLRQLEASVDWRRGVEDDQLWRLLRDASFSVFISLHEGFGLPVAESLACGTPVLTTCYGSQGEIARQGGCLSVDPRDDRSVEDGLERMLTDEGLLDRLRSEAGEYPLQSWDTYAARLWRGLVEESS